MSETARSATAVTPLAALSHDLMAALLPDGRIAWANPAWRRGVGWAAAGLAGRSVADLGPSGELPAPGAVAVLEVATRSGGARRIAFETVRADGVLYLC